MFTSLVLTYFLLSLKFYRRLRPLHTRMCTHMHKHFILPRLKVLRVNKMAVHILGVGTPGTAEGKSVTWRPSAKFCPAISVSRLYVSVRQRHTLCNLFRTQFSNNTYIKFTVTYCCIRNINVNIFLRLYTGLPTTADTTVLLQI
jgi:hypothetical protein